MFIGHEIGGATLIARAILKNHGDIKNINFDDAYRRVEKIRKDFFGGSDNHLVFGRAGSWLRYRDFLHDAETFLAKKIGLKKKTTSPHENTDRKDQDDHSRHRAS